MAHEPIDVLVIGAGPAGCAAAITATRAGARVLVLDRAQFPRAKTCGDAISNRGARVVDELVGVSHALHTVPHAIVRAAAALLPDGTRVSRSFGHEPGYIVPRLHLDDLLRRALEASSAQLRQGVKIRRLLVEGGQIVGAASDTQQWRAPITIAADGPGSLAWAALGRRYQRGRGLGVAITGYYELEPGPDDHVSAHYFEDDLPCGYGWVFPAVDGLANVGVYQRADHFERGHTKLATLLERFVARHPARLASARLHGKPRVWSLPLASRVTPPPAGPGVLACGDAGSFIDPLSGEGIWQALHTGALAGRCAVAALAHRGLDPQAVRGYQRACERAIVWPSQLRLGVQEAMRVLVSTRAYRRPLIKRALAWGYGGDALEITKRTS
ncbi:NAD(P)/FAD-dependent oxidoreductase [Enhygromyxa salina]|uniref:Putative oxidoreductase n=1 Tax=Enhygromyxa salina TaxID=215803 RepID=A0A2S9YKN0_9BACT|nr:geranylgeranyl reductase family protein [Enhygromyxa salina]PRQ05618.1 putative oxidoreductase [Enhygromyxa salina]